MPKKIFDMINLTDFEVEHKGFKHVWIISDTHFGKKNPLLKRPDDAQKKIIKNWNKMIKPRDVVFHLGDVAEDMEGLAIVKDLNGTKILIKGNHDEDFTTEELTRVGGFSEVHDDGLLIAYEAINLHIRLKTTSKIKILLTHEPQIFHNADINVHGHLHNFATIKSVCKLYNVALEETNYEPLDFYDTFLSPIFREKCTADGIQNILKSIKQAGDQKNDMLVNSLIYGSCPKCIDVLNSSDLCKKCRIDGPHLELCSHGPTCWKTLFRTYGIKFLEDRKGEE